MKSKEKSLRVNTVLLSGILALSAILFSSCTQSIEKMKSSGNIEGLIKAATYKPNTYSDELNESRDEARKALVEIGAPAVEPLLNTLQSEDQSVVGIAIELLGEIQDPKAAEGLIDYRFFSSISRYPARDMDAEQALLKIGPAAIDPMIETLKSDNPDAVRFAFDFLEIFEPEYDSNYVEALIKLVQNTEYRETALFNLSKSGDESIMEFMLDYMDEKMVSDGYFTEINIQYIQPVLNGQGISAVPYQTDSPSPHPVVVADETPFTGSRIEPHSGDPVNWNAYLPLSWRSLGEPESIQLVLCWDEIDTELIETAVYNDGTSGSRKIQIYTVSLREAATGNIVTSGILRGEEPKPLPLEKKSNQIVHYIGKLTPQTLINWLRPYVED